MPPFRRRGWVARITLVVPTLWLLMTLAFVLVRLAPGGPFDTERVLPAAVQAQIEAAYGLDAPLWQQYLSYLWRLLHADLGPSYQYVDQDVGGLILAGLPTSATLGATALLCAVPLGLFLGVLAAVQPGRFWDRLVLLGSTLGLALPNFVVAPMLVLLFALTLGWLPAGGWDAGWRSAVLPVLALAIPQVAAIARLSRGAAAEVMQAPYLRAARARGVPEGLVLRRHALRPILLPVLSYLGPAAAGILTGSVVIEQIFGLPGIGRYFVQGALNRDYTLVLGVTLFYGSLIILFNLLVDLLYTRLDPRLRRT